VKKHSEKWQFESNNGSWGQLHPPSRWNSIADCSVACRYRLFRDNRHETMRARARGSRIGGGTSVLQVFFKRPKFRLFFIKSLNLGPIKIQGISVF
jgi:hypothetical protein